MTWFSLDAHAKPSSRRSGVVARASAPQLRLVVMNCCFKQRRSWSTRRTSTLDGCVLPRPHHFPPHSLIAILDSHQLGDRRNYAQNHRSSRRTRQVGKATPSFTRGRARARRRECVDPVTLFVSNMPPVVEGVRERLSYEESRRPLAGRQPSFQGHAASSSSRRRRGQSGDLNYGLSLTLVQDLLSCRQNMTSCRRASPS